MSLMQALSRCGTSAASVGVRRYTSTQRQLTSTLLSARRRSNCHSSVNRALAASALIPAASPAAGKCRGLHTGVDGGFHQQQQLRTGSAVNQNSLSRLVVSRLMGLDDTQMFGVVHGGSIMQVMEEAGTILSTQYCNRIGTSLNIDGTPPNEEIVTVSACVEFIDFLTPMFVGDLAEVHAEVGFTSEHSVQVLVEVYAKNVAKGKRKLAARGKIWYVPLSRGLEGSVMKVPARTYTRGSPQVQQEGRVSYERLKALRQEIRAKSKLDIRADQPLPSPSYDPVPGTPAFATAYASIGLQPSSCWAGERYVRGGLVMKWMDECGSVCTSMHTSFYGYTAKVDTTVFLRKATVGGLMSITAKPIFASQKSLEVLIVADELRLEVGVGLMRQKTVEAIYTFISPGEDRKPRELPPLKLVTDEEKKLFEERKKLYEQRKQQTAVSGRN